jgi:hypothetical protein
MVGTGSAGEMTWAVHKPINQVATQLGRLPLHPYLKLSHLPLLPYLNHLQILLPLCWVPLVLLHCIWLPISLCLQMANVMGSSAVQDQTRLVHVALAIMDYARRTVLSSREVYLASPVQRNGTRKIPSPLLLELPSSQLLYLMVLACLFRQKLRIEASFMIRQSLSPESIMKYASKLQIGMRSVFGKWRSGRDRTNCCRSRLLSCFGDRYIASFVFYDGHHQPLYYRMDCKQRSFVCAALNTCISLLPIALHPYVLLWVLPKTQSSSCLMSV